MAFGGPLVYGHGEGDPAHNLIHDQTKKVNDVFTAIDKKHAKAALLQKAPRENQVPLKGKSGSFPGVGVADMSDDQIELVQSALKFLLAPYRKEDVDEVMSIVKQSGGVDRLHMAVYRQGDLDNDKVWDIWRIEGPSMVWHFRGAPHVHAYINVGQVG